MFTKIYATDHICVTDQVGTTAVAARRSTRNQSLYEDTGKCATNIPAAEPVADQVNREKRDSQSGYNNSSNSI